MADTELGRDNGPPGTTATTSAPSRRERERETTRPAPPRPARVPAPAAAADAAPAASGSRTASTTTPSASPPRAEGLSGHAANLPMAASALAGLAAISAGFGTGAAAPTPEGATSPPVSGTGAPTGPIAWDSGVSGQYTAVSTGHSERGTALGNLNSELHRLLADAAEDNAAGRAAVDAIVAEVDAALTALGPVAHTAAGRDQIMSTLGAALDRAEKVLGHNQNAAHLTAAEIRALAARFHTDSTASRPAGQGSRAGSGGPPSTMPAGQQGQWISEALRILREHGYDTSGIDPADIATIIAHESSGNPHAINLWDSNAAAGHPSKGLMQTIDSTFAAYSLPGHRDIWNPVDNIIAGVRYSIERYGSVANVPGVSNLHSGGHYVGY
ncbi:transglycosylase SLT domain-containing protein [Nocardia veterana]|nr:transglycosylase SLT domain-containing protein [Nocardia veterana]